MQARSPRYKPAAFAVAFAATILLVLAVDAVLSVGDRLGAIATPLQIVYYLALAALLVLGCIVPLCRVFAHPVVPLSDLYDQDGTPRPSRLAAFERHVQSLVGTLPSPLPQDPSLRAESLSALYLAHATPQITEKTRAAAKQAFLTTAVSQSSLVDAVTLLSINFNLVSSIVEACGYRPNRMALIRIYLRVLASSLVAGSLEEVDLESAMGIVLGGGAGGKASGVLFASAAQGLVNSFLVFRVSSITRTMLLAPQEHSVQETRVRSYKEAAAALKESGFMAEIAALVREKAGQMASTATAGVREKASEATQAVARGATSALSTFNEAVAKVVFPRSVGRLDRRDKTSEADGS